MGRAPALGIRWTVGDVSARGFVALRLSIWGAWRVFGPEVRYAVCTNTVPPELARARVGGVPPEVQWIDATARLPPWLSRHLDEGLAQGVAWKLAPPRLFPDRKELALDNDCILWELPPSLAAWWHEEEESVLFGEDVVAGYGQFADLCGPAPCNLGIRGLPARLDLEEALAAMLRDRPVTLTSELDEQGLQVASLSRGRRVRVVSLEEVAVASPFPPHLSRLGRCGAHFCGLNAKRLGWELDGFPAERHVAAFWRRHLAEVEARVANAGAGSGPPEVAA
jgi:hypothetical protein